MSTSKSALGFSLIELAMVIAVGAAIILLSVKLFTNVQTERKLATTQQQLSVLYNAALKEPNQAAKVCNPSNMCFGLTASAYKNPWNQDNSVLIHTVSGSNNTHASVQLTTVLPNAALCANFKDRFDSLQSSGDTSTCSATNDATTPSTATIEISMYP